MKWINSEILAGISIFLLGFLFYMAGLFNEVWAIIVVVDYLVMAIGIGVIILGVWTARNDQRNPLHTSHH